MKKLILLYFLSIIFIFADNAKTDIYRRNILKSLDNNSIGNNDVFIKRLNENKVPFISLSKKIPPSPEKTYVFGEKKMILKLEKSNDNVILIPCDTNEIQKKIFTSFENKTYILSGCDITKSRTSMPFVYSKIIISDGESIKIFLIHDLWFVYNKNLKIYDEEKYEQTLKFLDIMKDFLTKAKEDKILENIIFNHLREHSKKVEELKNLPPYRISIYK